MKILYTLERAQTMTSLFKTWKNFWRSMSQVNVCAVSLRPLTIVLKFRRAHNLRSSLQGTQPDVSLGYFLVVYQRTVSLVTPGSILFRDHYTKWFHTKSNRKPIYSLPNINLSPYEEKRGKVFIKRVFSVHSSIPELFIESKKKFKSV